MAMFERQLREHIAKDIQKLLEHREDFCDAYL